MSGGHGHATDTGGHGAGGHGAHGPAEIPAAPATRSITPSRADFEQPWPGRLLLWPVVWTVVGVLFALAAQRFAGPVDLQSAHGGGHGGGHEAAPGPTAPSHGTPGPEVPGHDAPGEAAPGHAPAGH